MMIKKYINYTLEKTLKRGTGREAGRQYELLNVQIARNTAV